MDCRIFRNRDISSVLDGDVLPNGYPAIWNCNIAQGEVRIFSTAYAVWF
jgi:hypothetical protein